MSKENGTESTCSYQPVPDPIFFSLPLATVSAHTFLRSLETQERQVHVLGTDVGEVFLNTGDSEASMLNHFMGMEHVQNDRHTGTVRVCKDIARMVQMNF